MPHRVLLFIGTLNMPEAPHLSNTSKFYRENP
jgi:hypothetical protein